MYACSQVLYIGNIKPSCAVDTGYQQTLGTTKWNIACFVLSFSSTVGHQYELSSPFGFISRSKGCVLILGLKSNGFPVGTWRGLTLVSDPLDMYLGSQGSALVSRVSGLWSSALPWSLCRLKRTWWLLQSVTTSRLWDGLYLSGKWLVWVSAPPSLRLWFSTGKHKIAPFRWGLKFLPKANEVKYFMVLLTRDRQAVWCSISRIKTG